MSDIPPPNWQEYVNKVAQEKEEMEQRMQYLQGQLKDLSTKLRHQKEG